MIRRLSLWATILSAAMLAGCTSSTNNGSAPTLSVGPDPSGMKYLLPQEPAGAQGVLHLRKFGKDGDEVIVEGRIGDQGDPWVEGRAQFVMVDTSFEACHKCEDAFCEVPKEELHAGRVSVKIVDEQ